jgi:hypothetical protein
MSRARARIVVSALLAFFIVWMQPAVALDRWLSVDRQVRTQVFQLNVAIKVQLGSGLYAQLADLSPRMKYPVFATTPEDKGFRVVGTGSCFAVQTARADRLYFVTNKHVVDFADGMAQECQRFFVAMRAHAKRTAGFGDADARYRDLMRVVSLCTKQKMSSTERQMYQSTVDAIWDTYDQHLSIKADPLRNEFKKYLKETGLKAQSAFFIHPAGQATIPAIEATIYRTASSPMQPDLALLETSMVRGISKIELDGNRVTEGQPIQAVGYPTNAKTDKSSPSYAPTFSTGRITRLTPGWIEFDAPVSKGDSGGPLINEKGRVIGVIVRRALSNENKPNGRAGADTFGKYSTAIDASVIHDFAPELFSRR